MGDLPFSELGEPERRLLAVFARYGRDGRAITVESLAAHTAMPVNSRELAGALGKLAARGVIRRGGGDPLPGSPVAYRLCYRLPR
jgi:hypothetical protein